jgi:hypothetical protein
LVARSRCSVPDRNRCTALAAKGTVALVGKEPTLVQLVSEIVALVAATTALVVTLIERRP